MFENLTVHFRNSYPLFLDGNLSTMILREINFNVRTHKQKW